MTKLIHFLQFCIFAAVEIRKTEEGTVVKHTGSQYLVSKLPHWNVVTCVLKGKLRLKDSHTTNPVAVGDRVVYETEDGVTGVIKEVYPRRNYIIRKSTNLSRQAHIIASNLDQVFLIVTLDFPKTKLEFIDRFLVTCEAYKVPVKILLNKADLYTDEFEAETEFQGLADLLEPRGNHVQSSDSFLRCT